MSALNEQLNSVEKREEYIENIPVNQGISNRCACCVFLIIVIFLDILFCVIFISDPKKNSWALAIAVIIDLPLGIYLRCCPHNTANSNSSPTYKKLKLFKDQNDMLVIDIDNAKYGNSYNPLKLIYDAYKDGEKDKALEMIDDLGYYLLYNTNDTSDPYWSNTAINYFTGIVLYLLENAKEEEINFKSVANISYKFMNDEYVKEFLKTLDTNSSIYSNLSGTLCTPMETRAGIFSTFNQQIKPIISKELFTNMLSFSDFDIKEIGKKKAALFIIGGNDIADRLTSLIVRQVYTATDLYGSDRRVNIFLDEFGYLMPIKGLYRMLTNSHGLNINFTAVIRSFMDLVNSYGKESTEILKQSFQNILYLMSTDNYTLEEISKMCGKKEDGTYLVDSEELKHLDNFEAIILTMRSMPIRTKLLPDYEINYGYEEVEKELPIRENKEIKIFEM